MIKQTTICLALILLLCLRAQGQENGAPATIITAQPGFYIGPMVVGTGTFQMENTVDFSASPGRSAMNAPTALLRYGLTPDFEIRLRAGMNLRTDSLTASAAPLVLGGKIKILPGNDKWGAVALRVSVRYPLQKSQLHWLERAAPEMYLATRKGIGERSGLFLNAGLQWAGGAPATKGLYAVAYEYSILPIFTIFVEHFGSFDKNGLHHDYDAGMVYLLSKDLQLDLSGGVGFAAGNFDGWFISTGFSFRQLRKNGR